MNIEQLRAENAALTAEVRRLRGVLLRRLRIDAAGAELAAHLATGDEQQELQRRAEQCTAALDAELKRGAT